MPKYQPLDVAERGNFRLMDLPDLELAPRNGCVVQHSVKDGTASEPWLIPYSADEAGIMSALAMIMG
jgi:hypothetical protein